MSFSSDDFPLHPDAIGDVDPHKNPKNNDNSQQKRHNSDPTTVSHARLSNDTSEKRTSLLPILEEEDAEELAAQEPEEEEQVVEYDVIWVKRFTWIKVFLIIFGRWPFTYSKLPNRPGYQFKFTWKCFGFGTYLITVLFTLYGFVAATINVVNVLMSDKRSVNSTIKTKTTIIEYALAERHTMILIIILGSYGINALTSLFIFVKRNEIAEMFTKWTIFLQSAKLSGGSLRTYSYLAVVGGNYFLVNIAYAVLTSVQATQTATFIGGPTVVSMLFMRHFFPTNYLENFVGSWRHIVMHNVGQIVYFYVITTANVYMFLFLWLSKSIEIALAQWNARMAAVLEIPPENLKTVQSTKDRTTYEALYHDHIGLVRMLSWFNNMFAYSLEPYVLFVTIKIVYQFYLAAIVIGTNGKCITKEKEGTYFIRRFDWGPAIMLTYENVFMLLGMLLASSWLEDTAYASYDDLRKQSLLKGTNSEKESYFYLSMFQSFTSTTTMAVYGGQFFCISRYSILHVLSAIMSNFLVVYQFRPLFDMDTVHKDFAGLRNITGAFLTKFEDLHPNHTMIVSGPHNDQC